MLHCVYGFLHKMGKKLIPNRKKLQSFYSFIATAEKKKTEFKCI